MKPVSQIEGHMKVEISIDSSGGQQQIVDARCNSMIFRDFRNLMKGLIPHYAPIVIQHISGVLPISHSQAAVLAMEDMSNWHPPHNARLLRNLTLGANFLQSHIFHFYLLALTDFVAGPASSPWAPLWQADMRSGLDKVASNLPAALGARRRAHEMGATFSGKMIDSKTFIPGGFVAIPTTRHIDFFRQHLASVTEFIESTYLPDVQRVGTAYSDYFEIGTGCRNLLAFGAFDMGGKNNSRLFTGGYTESGKSSVRSTINIEDINNSMKIFTNLEFPKDGEYSSLAALRFKGKPYESGPLARMWINGDYQRTISVMDRHVARALEAAKIASAMHGWLDELRPGQSAYDDSYDQYFGNGVGLSEAPSGALGHWVKIANGRISEYYVITPTCWNASPCDHQNVGGPIEQALIGTPINKPDQPIEALRVIHSYDPCLSCEMHIMRPGKKPIVLHTGG